VGKNSKLKAAVAGMGDAIENCENTVTIGELEKGAEKCAECTESPVCSSATDSPEGSTEEQPGASWECDGKIHYVDEDDDVPAKGMPTFGECLKIAAAVTAVAGIISLIAFTVVHKVTKERY
jgi:hypothetical protein